MITSPSSTTSSAPAATNAVTLPPSRPSSNSLDASELSDFRSRLAKLGYVADGSAHGNPWPINDPRVPANQMGAVWMDITPALAGQWLKRNFRNRPVSDDVVTAYARDMVNGTWVATHQGVAFNDQNQLIDGQHRLKAIVACGVTIRMMVTVGLPSQIDGQEMTTMDAVDRGRTRSVADQLKIQHGMAHGSVIAGICAILSNLCVNIRTRRLSVGQTLEVYRAFEPAANFVIAHRSKDYGLRSTGVLASFAFALMPECDRKDRTKFHESRVAKMFLEVTNLEKPPAPGTPARLLQDFLTSDEAKLITRSLGRGVCELAAQAIWFDATKKKPAALKEGLEGINYLKSLQTERVAQIASLFTLPGKPA